MVPGVEDVLHLRNLACEHSSGPPIPSSSDIWSLMNFSIPIKMFGYFFNHFPCSLLVIFLNFVNFQLIFWEFILLQKQDQGRFDPKSSKYSPLSWRKLTLLYKCNIVNVSVFHPCTTTQFALHAGKKIAFPDPRVPTSCLLCAFWHSMWL